MSLSAAMLEILMAEGLDGPALIRVAKAVEAREAEEKATRNAAKREQGAERQRRFKARKRAGNASNADNAGNALRLNDIYSKPGSPSEAKASPPPLETKLVADWNAGPAANGARKATKLDTGRKALLRARLRDNTEAELFEAMANLAASRFHCGDNNREWRASLGWFLKADNFLKMLELDPKARGPTSDLAAQAERYRNTAKPPDRIAA